MACGIVGNRAGEIAGSAWDSYSEYADTAFHNALEYIDALAGKVLTLQPVDTDINFDMDNVRLSPYEMPEPPDVPDMTYVEPTSPTDLTVDTSFDYTFLAPPDYDVVRPTLDLPTPPDALTADAPDTPPEITDVVVPDAPSITLPDVPVLNTITLPDPPDDLLIPEWDVDDPVFSAIAPVGDFSWTESPYTSDLLDATRDKITEWLAGGTGLPDFVWNLIWDRVARGNQKLARRAEMEATEEWSARGFFAPTGALNAALRRARQDAFDLDAEKLREIAIESAKMEVENLRFAVSQGISLEGQLITLHSQSAQRALEAEKATFDVAIALFNAQVSLYNAQIQGFVAKAQVYKSRIEAAMLYLEAYKTQLEGQKLIGDLNVQQVQIYTAELDAVTKQIEVYKAQLDGVRAQVDVDRNRIEAFRALVQAYGERVQAKQLEYQGYSTQIQGELAKMQIYQSETNAFASRMNGYVASQQAQNTFLQGQISIKDFEIKRFTAFLEKYKAEVLAESERIKSLATSYDGQAKVYQAQGEVEKTRASVDDRRFDLALQEGKARADLRVKEVELTIQQLLRLLQLEIEADRTVLSTSAQLAAAAMSAVNISAQVSEQAQLSSSCQETYSF